jgi:hypothetical protein
MQKNYFNIIKKEKSIPLEKFFDLHFHMQRQSLLAVWYIGSKSHDVNILVYTNTHIPIDDLSLAEILSLVCVPSSESKTWYRCSILFLDFSSCNRYINTKTLHS